MTKSEWPCNFDSDFYTKIANFVFVTAGGIRVS